MISVVIPAYNEESRLSTTILALKKGLPGSEIIVVDDGSADRSAVIAEKLGCRVLKHERNMGKGAAVKTGILSARSEMTLVTDADLAAPLTELPKLLAAINEGDVAIGSRMAPGAEVRRATFLRKVAGEIFSFLTWRITGLNIRDTQCGFKLFRTGAAKRIFNQVGCQGYAYDVEALLVAKKLSLIVKEVGIKWEDQPGTKVRLGRDSLRMLRELLEIRNRHMNCFPATTGTSVPESAH